MKIKPFKGEQPLPETRLTDNCIKFNIIGGKVAITSKQPLSVADFLQIVSTGILASLRSTVASLPEEQRQQATEDLYDMYNAAASSTLSYFAPEIEMRPHLTTQAILEAEDAIIDRLAKKNKQSQ